MGVVVTLKFKMAANSAISGGNSTGSVLFDLSESSNKSPKQLVDGPATSEQISALLPFKFSRYRGMRRHVRFVGEYNSHNARSSHESIA